MIMTAREETSPLRLSSSSWVAEFRAEEEGRIPSAADPSIFEEHSNDDDDDDDGGGGGGGGINNNTTIAAVAVAANDSTNDSVVPSRTSRAIKSVHEATVSASTASATNNNNNNSNNNNNKHINNPSLSFLAGSLDSIKSADFLVCGSKSTSSIELLKRAGLLEGGGSRSNGLVSPDILEATLGLSSLSSGKEPSFFSRKNNNDNNNNTNNNNNNSRPSSPIPASAATTAAKKQQQQQQQQPTGIVMTDASTSSASTDKASIPKAACNNTSTTATTITTNTTTSPSTKNTSTSLLSPPKSTVEPEDIRPNDVLSGRGGKTNHHIGNKRYRQVVADIKSKYRGISAKTDKTALSRAIVTYVNGYGGRFLRKENGKYTVMTTDEARRKTSQALRETKELKWMLHNS